MNATFNSKFQLLSSSPAKAPSFTHRFSPSWGPPLGWAPVVLLHPEDRPGSLRRDRGSWPSQGSLNRNRWMSPAGRLHIFTSNVAVGCKLLWRHGELGGSSHYLVPEKWWRFPIQNDQQLWTFDEFVVTHLGTMAIKPQTNQQVN